MTWAEAHKISANESIRNKSQQFEKRIGQLKANAKERIGQNNYADATKKLATYLNSIYYPTTTSDEAIKIKNFIEAIQRYWRETKGKNIRDDLYVGIGDNLTELSQKSGEKISLEKIKKREVEKERNKQNRQRITIQLIKDYDELMQRLNSVNGVDDLDEEFDSTFREYFQEVDTMIANFFEDLSDSRSENIDRSNFISFKVKDAQYYSLLKDLNLARSYLEIIKSFDTNEDFAMKDYGDILEWSLTALSELGSKSIEETVDFSTKEAVETMISKTAGRTYTEGKELFTIEDMGISQVVDGEIVFGKEVDGEIINKDTKYLKRSGPPDVYIEYIENPNNPNMSRQIKMDVSFKIPQLKDWTSLGRKNDFRISAKNWFSTSGRDFGETSIYSALVRSNPKNYLDLYPELLAAKSSIGNNNNNINSIHQLAKYSLLLDILMGYSQIEGYVDTVVINDRNSKEIKVFAIEDVLEKVKPDDLLEEKLIADYKIPQIEKQFADIFKISKNWDDYKDLSFREMLSNRVALKYSDIRYTKVPIYGKNGSNSNKT